jgi:hypothetical protein
VGHPAQVELSEENLKRRCGTPTLIVDLADQRVGVWYRRLVVLSQMRRATMASIAAQRVVDFSYQREGSPSFKAA